MKSSLTPDGQLVAENPSQCLLDASHRVRHSIFLRVQVSFVNLAQTFGGEIKRLFLLLACVCLMSVNIALGVCF